ncbi:MAG: DsbA family protein [Halodesulfurarchaeum sp.]
MTHTRRDTLTAGATLAAGTLAGCLGGGGSGKTVESLPTPALGPADAPVTVMGFEDFACPHCRTFALQHLPQLVSEYVEPGTIRYEHHDFPFVNPTWSWKVASGARAVQDNVGVDAFFTYSKQLYRNMSNYSLSVIGRLAEDVGADPETVRSAADELWYRPVLEADKQKGQEMGVQGTPTIFVNGQKAPDYSFQTVSSMIETQLG